MITVAFVKRPWWHPAGILIRWALPVSRFKWAQASHSMILDGDYAIHATMLHGVVRQPMAKAMRGQKLVSYRHYEVPNAEAGLEWARSQVGKNYDFAGAIGLALKPNRSWQEDNKWFCHELCAAAIHQAGRQLFSSSGHVTDTSLMLVHPGR